MDDRVAATEATAVRTEDVTLPNFEHVRSQQEFDLIQRWLGQDTQDTFIPRYGTERWGVGVFVCLYTTAGDTFIVINTVNGQCYFYLRNPSPPVLIEGQLVTYFRNWLSFVSLIDLKVVEIKLTRVSAKRALHHILGVERLNESNELGQ
jgi:hypothetical protein